MGSFGEDNPPGPGKGRMLRLFVVGDEPHSRRARENLDRICAERRVDAGRVEMVDVLEGFEPALENNIFLTPALLVTSSGPPVVVYGDLSDEAEVLRAIGLEVDN